MSFNQRLRNGRSATASAPLRDGVHTGAVVQMARVQPGTLCAELRLAVTTPGLLLTPSWQVSDDGARWVEVRPMNNAANVPFRESATVDLQGTLALSAHRFVRIAVTASGATPSDADTVASSYSWLEPDFT